VKTISQQDRRALVLGGAAVLGAVLVLRVVPWVIRTVRGDLTDLRERSTILAHARADLATTSELRDSAATMTQALVALAPRLLSGNTAAEAGADLSGRLNLVVTRNQGKLERLDPVADSATVGRLQRASAHVALETDIRGLTGFLRAVEMGDATLIVRDLRVVAPDAASLERQPEILKVEVTVVGWFLGKRGIAP